MRNCGILRSDIIYKVMMKIIQPIFQGKTYEQYWSNLLQGWREITDTDKKKQGIAIALSFLEQDENKRLEKVFSKLSINELKDDVGFDKLIAFLDGKIQQDDIFGSWDRFNDFEWYSRKQSICDFILTFDQK